MALAMTTTVVLLQLSAAAARPPLSTPAAVALPGCNATCGDVEVPYPFGFGPARCYWPGFNLTCDTSGPGRPRLLLGDGTLRVAEISLENATVRVIGKAGCLLVNDTIDSLTSDNWSNYYTFGHSLGDYGYKLSNRNGLIVWGCNVVAVLQGQKIKGEESEAISGCVSFCRSNASSEVSFAYGFGCRGCCMSPVSGDIALPIVLQIRSLYSATQAWGGDPTLQVYVVEEGRLDSVMNADDERPLILSWGLTWGPLPSTVPDLCTDDISRTLCKSEYSYCRAMPLSQVYNCECIYGFYGNPYLAGGCQDIDECKLPSEDNGCRSSKCINTLGSFYCECLPGSYSVGGGCVRKNNSTIAHASSQLSAPAPIALSGCNTTCGNVQVPHPFGFGPNEHCYRPGFNLTCDTSYDHPRLLLGDGTLQVVDIFLADSTVRVIQTLDSTVRVIQTLDFTAFDLPSISEHQQALFAVDPERARRKRVQCSGLSISIGVGSGAGFVLLVLFAIYMIRKLKDKRSMKLKKKFFKQNHGQLLQQLIAPRADIAERMIIPLKELEKATNNFDKAREVGGGGHGTVYKGILSDLHVVAIKKSNIVVKSEIDDFLNEVALLSQISHRNVVKLFGCCLETEVPLLIYEFVSNGTLYSHLHVTGAISLSWNDRLRIATETAKAIAYLHSGIGTPIIHRDIKSTNILLDDNLISKVSDFGASRHIPIDRTGVTTNVQGTIGYLDPSYYYTTRLTEKSDVSALGSS
ncbi:unnamed protein product [Urochloa decumbens]|uniref:Protein kinase domain-containing protein n=1 Tax=Urochloa decumbens TaxID=240449 RepID=A0ABC9AP12_9POAL